MKGSDIVLVLAMLVFSAALGCDKKTKSSKASVTHPHPAAVIIAQPHDVPKPTEKTPDIGEALSAQPQGEPKATEPAAVDVAEEADTQTADLTEVRRQLHELANSAVSLRTSLLKAKLTANNSLGAKGEKP